MAEDERKKQPEKGRAADTDAVRKSVSDDISKAARVVKAEKLRLPQNVKVIRPSDIKAMVERLVAEISSSEHAQTVAKIADLELETTNLRNRLAKLQSDRDDLAALAGEKDKQLQEVNSDSGAEQERLKARVISLEEELSASRKTAASRNSAIETLEEELLCIRDELMAEKEELASAREEALSANGLLETQTTELRRELSESRSRLAEKLDALRENHARELEDLQSRLEERLRKKLSDAETEKERLLKAVERSGRESAERYEQRLKAAEEELEKARLAAEQDKASLAEEFETRLDAAHEDARSALTEAAAEKDRLAADFEERLAALGAEREEELRQAGASRENIEQSYRDQLTDAEHRIEEIRTEAENTKQEALRQNEEKLEAAAQAAQTAAEEFEEWKNGLLRQKNELEERIGALEEELGRQAADSDRLQGELSRAKEEITAGEARLAGIEADKEERLAQETSRLRAELQAASAQAEMLLLEKEEARGVLGKTVSLLEKVVGEHAAKVDEAKSGSAAALDAREGLGERVQDMLQKLDDLARKHDELEEHYLSLGRTLVAKINELKAGLSFAAAYSVYDCQNRIDLAGKTAAAVRTLDAGSAGRMSEGLLQMLERAEAGLRAASETHEELLAEVDAGRADIRVIVELLKAETLRRLYGGWIGEIARITREEDAKAASE